MSKIQQERGMRVRLKVSTFLFQQCIFSPQDAHYVHHLSNLLFGYLETCRLLSSESDVTWNATSLYYHYFSQIRSGSKPLSSIIPRTFLLPEWQKLPRVLFWPWSLPAAVWGHRVPWGLLPLLILGLGGRDTDIFDNQIPVSWIQPHGAHQVLPSLRFATTGAISSLSLSQNPYLLLLLEGNLWLVLDEAFPPPYLQTLV